MLGPATAAEQLRRAAAAIEADVAALRDAKPAGRTLPYQRAAAQERRALSAPPLPARRETGYEGAPHGWVLRGLGDMQGGQALTIASVGQKIRVRGPHLSH